jgi:hypothetical protein
MKDKKITMAKMIGGFIFLSVFVVTACQVQFKMNGASIDYTQIKSMTIIDFPNRASLVYPPLEQQFNESLKDIYTRQTRLIMDPRSGDLQLEGEITGYDLTPMAIGTDAFAQETKLTVTIKVRFVNNKDHKQDFETTMSAHQTFPSSRTITEVQDELITEIIKELVENIYNKTVANW